MESMTCQSWNCEDHISPGNSKLLAEIFKEVDQSVKRMLKLIEEDGDTFTRNVEYHGKKPELLSHFEQFCGKFQTLADRYHQSTKEACKFTTPGKQIQASGVAVPDSNNVFQFFTPNEKLNAHESGHEVVGVDMHHNSGGYSSDFSLKDGSESSSPMSYDSESAGFYSIQTNLSLLLDSDGKGCRQKIMDQDTEVPVTKEKLQVNECYEELLVRITKYEEEQMNLKQKLMCSNEEVTNLKSVLKMKESLTGNLQARLDTAMIDILKKKEEIDLEKTRVSQMQNKISELEINLSDFNEKMQMLEVELKFYVGKMNESEEELIKLNDELARKVSAESCHLLGQLELAQNDILKLDAELQERRKMHIADLSVRDHKIMELSKSLEDEARQSEYEKMKMKSLYGDREFALQSEINLLKEENAEKCNFVEYLNEDLDKLKLKHDMVNTEKDNLNAKLETAMAEMKSKNNVIRHLEEKSNKAEKLVDELKMRVVQLETEVDEQREMILEAAEEKREAIRQLCFSLEYYRNWYHELRQGFTGHKRFSSMA